MRTDEVSRLSPKTFLTVALAEEAENERANHMLFLWYAAGGEDFRHTGSSAAANTHRPGRGGGIPGVHQAVAWQPTLRGMPRLFSGCLQGNFANG